MKEMNSAKSGSGLPIFNKSVSLLCWAYNEEDSISECLERATALLNSTISDYEIVLIDDGSTDKTYEIARRFQERDSRLKIYRNERNLNVGPSFIKAMQMASKEFLFWQTIDWCYDISNLRIFLEYLKTYDVVQGVRRKPVEVKIGFLKPVIGLLKLFGVQHITRRSDTISKAIISVTNYLIIRILFRIPLSDFQNVTFYPTKWVKTITVEARSSFVNPELLIKSYWSGMSIKEVPISFIPRSKGEAKGSKPKAIMNSVKDILTLWFKWVVIGGRGKIAKGKISRLNKEDQDLGVF
jgi:glycosyltransferase involved in cell wall biosynthesis